MFDELERKELAECCEILAKIKTARDFYPIIRRVNSEFSVDIVTKAREIMNVYNTAQYPL